MKSKISFHPLQEHHLPLVMRWLQEPHVLPFYSVEEEELRSYVSGYKRIGNGKKPLHAFLFFLENEPIGYIQYYSAYDFPRKGYDLGEKLRHARVEDGYLAALDLFIGEKKYIGQGIAPLVIQKLLEERIWKEFSTCLVDPTPDNLRAVRAFKKAGFLPATSPLLFCHKTGRIPIFIRTGIYGVAKQNDSLLVIRQQKGLHEGKWDLPGGGLDPGETIEEALAREFHEEVGMGFQTSKHFCNLTAITYDEHTSVGLQQVGLIYQVQGLYPMQIQTQEFEPTWLSIEHLRQAKCTPFLQEVLSFF